MAVDEERMRAELEKMAAQADMVTNESLDSTRRMLAMAEETRNIGTTTMETLDEQGEQLDRIEEGLDQINEDVRHAEKNLTEMEKCCGLCLCPCKRTKNIEKTVEYQKTFADGNRDGVITEQPGFGTARRTGGNTEYSGYITRVTNDAREDEMDENIGQVVRIVEDLKGIAIDMGTEVDKQNSQLEIINKKADLTEGRVRMADQRTKGLLNS